MARPVRAPKIAELRDQEGGAGLPGDDESSISGGTYVDPQAGRLLLATHGTDWLASRNGESTTRARDESVMRTHVLPKWGDWQLAKIDHLSVQGWVSELGRRRSPATVAEALRLTSGCSARRSGTG